MSATLKTDAELLESTSGTLGDLVYSDKAKARVSEEDWLAIVQSIAAGDRLALKALYERTHCIVFTLAMRIIENRESAEEVTLDVFHEIWSQAATYDRAAGSVLSWITSVARSKARLRFEQQKRRVLPGASPHHEAPAPANVASLRGLALEHTVRAHFPQHTRTALALEEQEAIESALFSKSTYLEVAARLCQPPGTVRTRVRYGLAKLRIALARHGRAS